MSPSTNPFGAKQATGRVDEVDPFTRAHCRRFSRNSQRNSSTRSLILKSDTYAEEFHD